MGQYSIDYQCLGELAHHAGLACSAAHLHGQVLALISVHDGGCEWPSATLFGATDDNPGSPLHAALDTLYRETWRALDGPGVGFNMLLPDEDAGLEQRGRALCEWAAGFLHALPSLGVDPERHLDLAGRAALRDIHEVAYGNPLEVAADDEEFTEVSEFLWIAVVLVRELLIVHRERG